MFSNYNLKHCSHTVSDHYPLILNTCGWVDRQRVGSRQIRFEATWLLKSSFEKEVGELWAKSMGSVPHRIHYMGWHLMEWAKRIRNQSRQQLEHLRHRLNDLNKIESNDTVLEELVIMKIQLNLEVDKGERYMEQWARTNWLRNDDCNTNFVHKMATHRKESQLVQQLKDENGTVHKGDREIERIACDYFTYLFKTKGGGDGRRLLSRISIG